MKTTATLIAATILALAAPTMSVAQEAPSAAPHWVNVPLPPKRPMTSVSQSAAKLVKAPVMRQGIVISAGTGF